MMKLRMAAMLVALWAPTTFVWADEPRTAIGKDLVAAVQPFVDNGNLAGAVMLVASKERVLAVESVGYADVAAKTPMKSDATFWIASMSKPITAAAVMILVDDGKIKLDDPANKYLPELNDLWVAVERDKDHQLLKRPSRPPTIRELLAHTSGMAFRSAAEEPTLDAISLRATVKTYAMTPLVSEPGTKYLYSNAGINTAARIIEVVTGMSFEEFLDKRLLAPLGMRETTFWPNEAQLKRLATGHKPGPGGKGLQDTKIWALQYPLDNRTGRFPMPGGGLFSTADDCGRFCRMMLNGGTLNGQRVLSEAAVEELTKRQTPPTVKENYGLGFALGDRTFGHGGAWATNMTVDRKSGLVLVYLVQHAGFPGDGAKAQDAFRNAATAKFGVEKR